MASLYQAMEQAATALRVLELLRDGPQTAQQLAEDLGLDTSSVRRHLETLRIRGLISAEDKIQGPGRPKRRYDLTENGWESFPRDYAFLLRAVLARIESRHGREAVLEAFDDIAQKIAQGVAGKDMPTRLESLERIYNDLGFEATVEREGGALFVVQRNCPFLKAAKDDPHGLCECLDERIMQNALPGAKIRLEQSMATGASFCRHEIKVA